MCSLHFIKSHSWRIKLEASCLHFSFHNFCTFCLSPLISMQQHGAQNIATFLRKNRVKQINNIPLLHLDNPSICYIDNGWLIWQEPIRIWIMKHFTLVDKLLYACWITNTEFFFDSRKSTLAISLSLSLLIHTVWFCYNKINIFFFDFTPCIVCIYSLHIQI